MSFLQTLRQEQRLTPSQVPGCFDEVSRRLAQDLNVGEWEALPAENPRESGQHRIRDNACIIDMSIPCGWHARYKVLDSDARYLTIGLMIYYVPKKDMPLGTVELQLYTPGGRILWRSEDGYAAFTVEAKAAFAKAFAQF